MFESAFGLRLISMRNQGIIRFETSQGMLARFGWGMDEAEAEEPVTSKARCVFGTGLFSWVFASPSGMIWANLINLWDFVDKKPCCDLVCS